MRYLVKGNLGWSVGAAWLQGLPIPSRTSPAAFLAIGLSVGRSLDQNALETFSFSSSLPFSLHASRNARHLQAPISNYLTASGAAKSRPPSHTLGEEQTRIWQVMGRPSHHSCNLVLAGGRWIDSTGQKLPPFWRGAWHCSRSRGRWAAVPIPDWRTPLPSLSLELMLAKE
jgi:hypothetical protein